ncbi:MAG: IPT/TIG domain-containing protein [Deltaproteobacteria bacterium]|nr:IPT/TIG domain-containing protein [Deltaproteobacteria bacterium]
MRRTVLLALLLCVAPVLAQPTKPARPPAAPPAAPPPAAATSRIVKFEPTRGLPGTRVRVFVLGLAATDTILYGGKPVPEIERTPASVDVVVPPGAKSAFFAVKSPAGTSVARERFGVVKPPVIVSFAPLYGPPGARVEIAGTGFEPGDTVSFDGRLAKTIEKMTATKLVVQVPEGARSSVFTVQRMGMSFPGRKAFEVVLPPVLTGIEPTEGLPGAKVRLTGQRLTKDAKVTMAGKPMKIVGREGEESLQVQVPAGVVSGAIAVQTRGGRATAPVMFLIVTASEVLGVSPPAGRPGAQVTIRVSVITGRDRFFFNGRELKIIGQPPEGYLVLIPENAVTDYIEWESFGVRKRSRFKFEVIQPPMLTGMQPQSGPPGTRVAISGRALGPDVRVSFGGLGVPIVERSAERLLVVVPNAPSNVFEVRVGSAAPLRTPMFRVLRPTPIGPPPPAPRR